VRGNKGERDQAQVEEAGDALGKRATSANWSACLQSKRDRRKVK